MSKEEVTAISHAQSLANAIHATAYVVLRDGEWKVTDSPLPQDTIQWEIEPSNTT